MILEKNCVAFFSVVKTLTATASVYFLEIYSKFTGNNMLIISRGLFNLIEQINKKITEIIKIIKICKIINIIINFK